VRYEGDFEPRYIVTSGDLLIGMDGEFRCHIWRGADALLNQRVCRLTNFSSALLPRFLYYGINNYLKKIEDVTAFTTVKHLSSKTIGSIQFPLPPLEEQRRIVAILDEAFEGLSRARANAEANFQSARELFESCLNAEIDALVELYGTEKVADLCDAIVDCPNRTAPVVDYPTEYKMIRTTNIRNGRLSLDQVRYVTAETYERWTRRQVPEIGDVLLTREAPLGEAAKIVTDDHVFLGQRIVSYRVNREKLFPDFLLLSFRSKFLKAQFENFAAGATVQHMRVPQSKELEIPRPPMAEQSSSIEKLNRVLRASEDLAFSVQKSILDIDELRQSLLQKAFAGELTIKEFA
jgi:type I restriction enzyme S subunit